MTEPSEPTAPVDAAQLRQLDAIQRRVLWLAVRMVDHANHRRPNPDGVKVGGHQASSASMVSIMTALYVAHLRATDLVSVKPHASPVFHALQYLCGNLDERYLTQLRALGGLQAYPSRTKDPDPVDFSTGSVGLGAVAPLFAGAVRRYVEAHFGAQDPARFIALIGDAELDEGNIWEAVLDPATAGLGNTLIVVDLNRQSLDRVVPGIRAGRLGRMFADNGWHVVEAKYGRRLQRAFAQPGGDALRRWIDDMPNEQYQSLFAFTGEALRDRFLDGADPAAGRAIADIPPDELAALVHNLGGHDLKELLSAYRAADEVPDRPSIVFAYTVKGWGLPIAGDPLNHSALLTDEQLAQVRNAAGVEEGDDWARFPDGSAEAELCQVVGRRLATRPEAKPDIDSSHVPVDSGLPTTARTSTQEAFGRCLLRLGRNADVGPRLVTVSPDVAVSTNLGGWINKVGVFSPEQRPDFGGERTVLRWREHPRGQHLELGISEMNLFMLLGQLGLSRDLHGTSLLPIGTVYDPFVCRGLDALIYGVYSDARFVVVGTPSGISLSPEGGAHQSTVTPSIGLELPGLTYAEPAYAKAMDWLLCDGLGRLHEVDGESLYLRLTTRPLTQEPFEQARQRDGDEALRAAVVAGGYRLVTSPSSGDPDRPTLTLCASGAVVPEALAAAAILEWEGVSVDVIDVTCLDRLYREWKAVLQPGVRNCRAVDRPTHVETLLGNGGRPAPIVTVHDAASHAMSWLGSVFGAPVVPLGVDSFGQSGSVHDLYALHDLLPGAIVNAGLLALHRQALHG